MNTEDRVRAAVRARTEGVEPTVDGWDRIQDRIQRRERHWRRPTVMFPAVAAVLATVVLAAILLPAGDEGTGLSTEHPAATPPEPATTTAPPVDAFSRAVWPVAGTSRSFDDPRALVLSFAKEFLGMPTPSVGQLQKGGPNDGEIALRPRAGSPMVTTVLVAQDTVPNAWIVTGAVTGNLQLQVPEPLASVSSPVTLAGASRAFEATVQVAVLEDGDVLPFGSALARRYFTGGGGGAELAPFETSISFHPPTKAAGTLVLWPSPAEERSVVEATVIRVRFPAPAGTSSPTTSMPPTTTTAPASAAPVATAMPATFVVTNGDYRLVHYRTSDMAQLGSRAISFGEGGVSMAADRARAYLDRYEGCAYSEEVRLDGMTPGERINGSLATESPDGRMLAYTGCNVATIIVRDRATGQERTFGFGQSADSPQPFWALSWDAAGRTLAYQLRTESGVGVYVLDTGTARSLDDAKHIRHDTLEYRNPVFAGTQLAVSTTEGVMLVDPNTGRATPLFNPGKLITGLEVDASGQHFLFIVDGADLYRWSAGRTDKLASNISDADW